MFIYLYLFFVKIILFNIIKQNPENKINLKLIFLISIYKY